MTNLVITVPSADGARTFELLVSFDEAVTIAETCIEVIGDQREWRDTRSVLLRAGRKPRATGDRP